MVLPHCFPAISVANKNFNDIDTCLVNEHIFTLHIILDSYLIPAFQKCDMMFLFSPGNYYFVVVVV